MNATAIRDGARVAALIVILVLAAVLGLVVGNALNGRIQPPASGAQASGSRQSSTGRRRYADPHVPGSEGRRRRGRRLADRHQRRAAADASDASTERHQPPADPPRSHSGGPASPSRGASVCPATMVWS